MIRSKECRFGVLRRIVLNTVQIQSSVIWLTGKELLLCQMVRMAVFIIAKEK
ncbi:MAG: hypothetical protein J6K26_02500 [Lachnospiraceae bacterium]|nr:hypothetical protein [Lachnospiraceae bacterium]